jgi:phosphatidylserine/phosphatidylglycerophosphate/cardiolipin synthase-like enzyme
VTSTREIVRSFLSRRKSAEPLEGLSEDDRATFEALAVLADHYESGATRVTPVATTPRAALRARRSAEVMRELIDGAKEEITVLGYEISDVAIIEALARRASLGVVVDLIVDTSQTPMDRLMAAWPGGAGPASVWGSARDDRDKPYRLHAKAVIADGRRCMIGSANLTYSGLTTNLELGVLLEGHVVPRVRAYVTEMVERGIVVRVATLGESSTVH